MTAKDRLQLVAKLLFNTDEDVLTQVAEVVEFKKKLKCLAIQDKTSDGAIVSFDELKEGNEILITDEAGETIPLGDGEYELTISKSKITVKDGKIEAIVPVEEVVEPEEEVVEEAKETTDDNPKEDEEKVEEEQATEPSVEERLTILEQAVLDIKEMLTELTDMYSTQKEEHAKQLKEFSEQLKEFGEQPQSKLENLNPLKYAKQDADDELSLRIKAAREVKAVNKRH